jgi:hypothetical protein
MKKRLLAILLTICMVAALLPTAAFAAVAETDVASIGDTGYATLAAAINEAQSGSTITLLKSTSEDVTFAAGKKVTLELNGQTLTGLVTVNGELTVTDATGTGKIKRNGYAVDVYGKFTLQSGNVETTSGTGINAEYNSTVTIDGGTVESMEFAILACGKSVVTVNDGVLTANDNAVIGGNGTNSDTYKGYTINVNGGELIGHIKTAGYVACGIYHPNVGTVNINGGEIKTDGGCGVLIRAGKFSMTAGTITVTGNTTGKVGDSRVVVGCYGVQIDSEANYPQVATLDVSIAGGKIDASNGDGAIKDDSDPSKMSITGGYFSSDPTAYVKTGYAAVSSDTTGYAYQVVDASTVDTVVKPLVADKPTADVDKIDEEDQKAVEDAIETISIPDVTNTDTANDVTELIQEKYPDELAAAVAAAKEQLSLGADDEVIVYTQISLEVKAETYDDEAGELTLDITPKATLIASTAKTERAIVLTGDGTNAVAYETEIPVTIGKTVEVSITLPDGFGNSKYVEHTTEAGNVYVYTGTIVGKTLTFSNPDGFSKFKITKNGPVATIQGSDFGYTSLSDAFANVENGDTITVADGTTENIYVDGTITFTIKGDYKGQVVATNIYTTVTPEKVDGGTKYVCVYTAPSVPVYRVVVNDAEGGKIKASANKAAEGATIVLTPVADDEEGELETLAVVDEDGNAVTLTKRANGTYSFVMPAKAVTVTGTFTVVADPEEPDEDEEPGDEEEEATVFTDVDEDAYYAEAVAWAVANEITKGTSETTFSPDDDCTRAQVVTFLWRYAGKPEPTTTENPFTDVEEGTDYYKAILWAYENGITTGTSETTFSPDDTCTRAQVVTFLWRYEGELTYEEAETFTDVAEDAYYAKAVAWAVHEWITNGTGDGQFSPDETCSRGQVVTFLYRDTAEG